MNDELRQNGDFVEPSPGKSGVAHDEELRSVLQAWQAPGAPESLDARLCAAYRNRLKRTSLWKRIFTAKIPVPIPVALTFIVLLLIATVSALRAPRPAPLHAGQDVAALDQTAPKVTAAIPNQSVSGATSSANLPRNVSAIVLQTEQGSIPIVTDTKYRLNPTPKIYVGGFFNPSSER
ncbi:MAG: hypothetical protein LAP85_07375 [Acidobacteriia bacterium]|nr:hypothetical protein [Terriglobia bacterium]